MERCTAFFALFCNVILSKGLEGCEGKWNAELINEIPKDASIPSRMQAAANTAIPIIMLRGTSLILRACLLLALERNVIPNNLTNVADAIPIVSAKGKLANAIDICSTVDGI